MKVKELIELLQQHDPELPVVHACGVDRADFSTINKIEILQLHKNKTPEYYEGEYIDHDRYESCTNMTENDHERYEEHLQKWFEENKIKYDIEQIMALFI